MGNDHATLFQFRLYITVRQLKGVVSFFTKQVPMSALYSSMLKLPPDVLINLYANEYRTLYGDLKSDEVIGKVLASEKTKALLYSLNGTSNNPTVVGIGSLLLSMPYFLFAKAETVCFAGLAILTLWDNNAQHNFDSYDPEFVSALCSDYIIYCSRMKFNRRDNCFTKFYALVEVETLPFHSCDTYVVMNTKEMKNRPGLYLWTLKKIGDFGKKIFHYSYRDIDLYSYLRFERSEYYEKEVADRGGKKYNALFKKLHFSGHTDFEVDKTFKSITKGKEILLRIKPTEMFTLDKYVIYWDASASVGDILTLDLDEFGQRDKYLNHTNSTTGEKKSVLFTEIYSLLELYQI